MKILNDGANEQAQAVACFINEHIEDSWNSSAHYYTAEPKLGRWENCREQGYVLRLRVGQKQLNIAFFEHRNSDNICAIRWEQLTINSPTIDTAEFGGVYKDKWDTSFSAGYGEVYKLAEWINDQMDAFYDEHKAKAA